METPDTISLLFVDDDMSYMAVAQQLLAKYQGKKFNIIWKQDGPAALEELKTNTSIDLILVDYRPATELSTRTLHAHLASGLLRAPVAGVMVAGEIVLDHGALVTVDENEVVARARACARRVWARL